MFYFGAATSSHQVEGGNHNDWSEWELKTAGKKALSAKNKKWPDYIADSYPSPKSEENYISGIACDHYHQYEKDFDIAKSLGHNAHRFSIEWSRIEPEEGKFDEKEIEHYRRVIHALRARGLEPFVTLWHWVVPVWFAKKDGWENRENIHCFARYTEKIVSELGNDVNFWITLNEPEVNTSMAYISGTWPPQKKSLIVYWRVMHNLIRGHRLAHRIIKEKFPGANIGIAKNNFFFESAGNPINKFKKACSDWWWNHYFLNRIRDCQDFIGLNHYFHRKYGPSQNKMTFDITDINWEIYPEGIYHVLKDLARYKKPVYITENGVADVRDAYRETFIRGTLGWIKKAMGEGVDIRGYFHWSLLDNFEWANGFWPRFGLVAVDYKTLERKIRPSAFVYKKMIEDWDKDMIGKV